MMKKIWAKCIQHHTIFLPIHVGLLIGVAHNFGFLAAVLAFECAFAAYIFGVGVGIEAGAQSAVEVLKETIDEAK